MLKRFNIYFALLSAGVDLVALLLAMVVAYRLRAEGTELYYWPFLSYLKFILLMLPIWLVLLASQGLYKLRNLPKGWNAFSRLLIGLLSGWGVMIIILFLWKTPQAQAFPRLVVAYGLFLTLLFTLTGRLILGLISSWLYQIGVGVMRTVIVSNHETDRFIASLQQHRRHGRRVVAVINDQRSFDELDRLFKEKLFDELVVDDPDLDEQTMLELLRWAEDHGVNFTLVPGLLSVRATNVEAGSLAGSPVMYFLRTPLEGWRRVYKRLLDLILVIPAIIILSPLLLVTAILVKLQSPGPLLHKQIRVGQDGKTIGIHKFRSMRRDAEATGPGWTVDNDPRITKIGRFLRKTNLDELPQLFDILIGQLSFVGPRPEQPKYVEKFSQEIPNYLRRHHVKSGLTGWAQINGLRGDTSIPERLKYDLYYIENWSIWFDIRIILSTFVYVIRQMINWSWR